MPAQEPTDARTAAQLSQEQERVDLAYGRLDATRAAYRGRLREVRRNGPSGSPQNRSERDAFASHYEATLTRLDHVENQLVFGRLDLAGPMTRYVGRIGLQDEERRTILVDWRAPSARPFYQATAAHPGDVVRRRHLMTRGRRVIGVEDELLDAENIGEMAGGLSGEGALFAAMSARREGRMSDIVSTIQAEQDAVVRAPADGVLVVQGGPGTGKTAVALHRVAYLLYTHRERLERSGVLMVGPSHAFLRYIEQVLPSLGESDVVSTTMADLLPGVRAVPETDREVARAKGDAAWEKVLARAVRSLQRVPDAPRTLDVDGVQIVLRPEVVRAAIGRAHRTGQPHNQAWETYARAVLDDLVRQYTAARGEDGPADEDADERRWLFEDVRSNREVRIAVNLCWLPTSASTLLERLYARPELLERHGRGLSPARRALVARPTGAPWTDADVPLLDELAELLGPLDGEATAQAKAAARRREEEIGFAREAIEAQSLGEGMVSAEVLAERAFGSGPARSTADRAAADREWTYGHVVVDEAQEITPMGWRALARRCPARSFTVVGDLAQHSSRDVPDSWAQAVGRLGRGSLTEAVLTISYRTPATVLDLAGRVLETAGVSLPHPVRAARDLPDALDVRDAGGSLTDEAVAATRRALAALTEPGESGEAGEHAADSGRVAVIAAAPRVAGLRNALSAALRADGLAHVIAVPDGGAAADPLASRVSVIDPLTAKGLEFDEVVVVEPAELLEEGPGDLYVAMTRPTRRLTVLHDAPLPSGF